MQNSIIRFADIGLSCQSGITLVDCGELGTRTFCGYSKEGDAILQDDTDGFTTIPELTWNIMSIQSVFEPETHVRYINQKDLESLHDDTRKFLQVELAEDMGMVYQYEATIHIRKIYK